MPTAIGLAVVVGVLAVDLVTGAHLQLSTAFGYTPSIGVRFAGVGNVAYAFLGASTVFSPGSSPIESAVAAARGPRPR